MLCHVVPLTNYNIRTEHMHITKAPFVDCSSHDSLMVWSALVHVTPDIILDLCEARLRVRSDNTSTVEFSFAITGTAVLPNNTSPIMAGARPPDPCLVDDSDLDQSIDSLMEDVTSNDSSSTHDTFEMRDLSEQLNNKMVLSRKDLKPTYQRHIRQAYDVMNAVHKNDLLATPHRTVQLRFRGNVKMHLDNEHRIWLMQWVVH